MLHLPIAIFTYVYGINREAIRLVTAHGCGVSKTARNLGINSTMLGRWKPEFETKQRAALPEQDRHNFTFYMIA